MINWEYKSALFPTSRNYIILELAYIFHTSLPGMRMNMGSFYVARPVKVKGLFSGAVSTRLLNDIFCKPGEEHF